MLKVIFFSAFMFLASSCFAAGGTCPTGANYLSLSTPQTGGGLGSVTLSSLGITSCYFVSTSGADTNAGTTEGAPFLHAPGMPNCASSCASASTGAAVGIILEGGQTWHRSSGTVLMGGQWSIGTYGYVGIDLTWFAGGSFARPIISMDNPLNTSTVSSCSFDDGAASALNAVTVPSGTIFDGVEFTGSCSTGAGNGSYVYNSGGTIERCYAHGWTVTTTAIDDSFAMFYGAGTSTTARYLFDVEDGVDSSLGTTCTNTSCVSSGQATGWGMRDCWDVEFSIMRHSSQGEQCNNLSISRGNLFEYLFEPTVSSRHGNILEGITGNSLFIFNNNIVRNVNEGVGIWPVAATIIEFNDTFENVGNGQNCIMLSPATNNQAGTAYIYNVTADGTCASRAVAQSPVYGTGSTFVFGNNHLLDKTGIFTGTAFFTCSPGAGNTCTTETDNLGEVFQTTAVANGQGYTLANDFFPTSVSNATIGAGVNLTSTFCSTVSGFNATAGTDCLSASPKGVVEVSGWGGELAQYPATTVNARGISDWDAGAYQYNSSGASFTCSPSTLPANHSGHIALTCTATGGLTWNGSTAFNTSGTCTYVSTSNTGSTSQTVTVTTGGSTGTCTIADTTDSVTSPVTVATATLSISPNSGNTSTTPSLTLTGANTLWNSETASSLFSLSGGGCSGESLTTPTIVSNTSATATLTTGSAACTITVTDNSTGATTTFTVTSSSAPIVAPAPAMFSKAEFPFGSDSRTW